MLYIYLMSNTHGDDVIPKSLIKLANHLRFKLWRCLPDFHCFVLKSLRSASLCALLYNCFSLSLHISEEALHVLSCYFYLLTCILSTRKPVHLSTLFTRPLTCVLLLPCLLIQATRSLVHLVHSSTHITTYIFLGIGFFVLYLCIVIRNEGMTNGVLMNQIIYNN